MAYMQPNAQITSSPPLEEIAEYCIHAIDNSKSSPSLLRWLTNQAVQRSASDLHIDWSNNHLTIRLRINGILNDIAELDLETSQVLIRQIKSELDLNHIEINKPWSGTIPDKSAKQKHEIHIIPFQPVASVIIRILPLATASPTWTASPNINKKLFIWQMGKVGSTTVFSSLKPYTSVYNWHFVAYDQQYLRHNNLIHSHSTEALFNILHYSDEEFIIISLVRDLLSRNISAVFQSMSDETPGNPYFIATELELQQWSYKQLHNKILANLQVINLDRQLTSWYDNLFRTHFYYPDIDRYFIDVFGKPFDKKKGIQNYYSKTLRIKLLIVRLEDLNNQENNIGHFLDLKNFKLRQDNITAYKWYNNIYKQFRQSYTPSFEELNHIYCSRFMNYFYGHELIAQLRSRWEKT